MKLSARSMRLNAFIAMVALVAGSYLLSSYKSAKMADDIWKMLGISSQTGTNKIRNSFLNGYLDHYGLKNLKNIAMNDRAAIAKDLLTYTKSYVSGPEFRKEYEKTRAWAKPTEPELKRLRSLTEIQKEEIAKTEKSIKDAEKSIKEMPDLAQALKPVLDMLKQNLKEYKDSTNQYFKSLAMGEKYDNENRVRSYEEAMKRWEEDYPAEINQFIAGRLKTLLEKTEGIDYNAQLVEKYGKKRFVNPTYESKNTEWKQGFRAGKEVTEAAREFGKRWLEEVE